MFHTDEQEDPWAILDLQSDRPIHQIVVNNREDCCKDRAVPLVVETSTDEKTWVAVAEKKEVFDTWTAEFPRTNARYVRFHVPRKTLLHLQDISIF